MSSSSKNPPAYTSANSPATLDALKDAVGFVAEGRPVSQQLAVALRRMLSQLQERTDIVQLVLDHHQMQRLVTVYSRLIEVEDFFFSNNDPDMTLDKQLKAMSAKDRIALLTALQREVNSLVTYTNKKSSSQTPMKSAPNEMQEAATQQSDEQLEAAQRSGTVPQEGRERIRAVLERLEQKSKVIDMEPALTEAGVLEEEDALKTLEETIAPPEPATEETEDSTKD